MSVQATTWVWDHSKAEDNTRLVALAIADAANAQGSESCQSVRTLGRMALCSESSVHRAIKWLLDAGEIECIGQNQRYGGTNIYRFRALWNPAWGGVNMTPPVNQGGVTGDTGGVSSGPGGGVTGDTQPQRTPQGTNPTFRASDDAPGEEQPTPTPSLDAKFADWWQIYPKKVDKKKAEAAFAKAHDRVGFEVLRHGLIAYVKALQADGKVTVTTAKVREDEKPQVEVRVVTGAAVLNPTTWLNGDRWEDDHGAAFPPKPTATDENGEGSWMHRTKDE